MIELENISKRLGAFELKNISFRVEPGEYFVLLGESGAGKSVLLELIAGLIAPDGGRMMLSGRDITDEKVQHRSVGLVYQDQSIFPHLSVAQNIAYPLKCRKMASSAIQQEVGRLAEKTGVTHLLDRRPGTLSIGEAQLTTLARTLATAPDLLLLDEPLASLDAPAKVKMRSLLREINQSGQTVVHVTHDYEEAIALADRVAVIENRTIVQTGTPEEIFHYPQSEFVARFVGIKNFYRGQVDRSDPKAVVFETQGVRFEVSPEAREGPAVFIVRSEEITVIPTRGDSGVQNLFEGRIVDIEPGIDGVELAVDIGVRVVAKIPRASEEPFSFKVMDRVWIHFKAMDGVVLEELI